MFGIWRLPVKKNTFISSRLNKVSRTLPKVVSAY